MTLRRRACRSRGEGGPTMWGFPGFRSQENPGDPPGQDAATLFPALADHRHRGRKLMQQMLIAAAIAAGLVALCAALLPIVA
jgi:hypothetical protein